MTLQMKYLENFEKGKAEGKAVGKNEERINAIENMLQKGKTVQEIVDFCGYPYEEVQAVEDSMVAKF